MFERSSDRLIDQKIGGKRAQTIEREPEASAAGRSVADGDAQPPPYRERRREAGAEQRKGRAGTRRSLQQQMRSQCERIQLRKNELPATYGCASACGDAALRWVYRIRIRAATCALQ